MNACTKSFLVIWWLTVFCKNTDTSQQCLLRNIEEFIHHSKFSSFLFSESNNLKDGVNYHYGCDYPWASNFSQAFIGTTQTYAIAIINCRCNEEHFNANSSLVTRLKETRIPILKVPFTDVLFITRNIETALELHMCLTRMHFFEVNRNILHKNLIIVEDSVSNISSSVPAFDLVCSCSDNKPCVYARHDTHSETTVNFHKRPIRVALTWYSPFVDYRKTSSNQYYYVGYCIEIIQYLQQTFNFSIQYVRQWSTGTKKEDGQWSGALGTLVRGSSDTVLTGLTITNERAEVMDFTYPFWEEPSAVLTKITEYQLFVINLLKPVVWMVCITAMVSVSVTLFLVEKFSILPAEGSRHSRLSFTTSLILTYGIALMKGLAREPSTTGGYILLKVYLLGAFCIAAIVCGNLITSLTINQEEVPFETLAELADDPNYVVYVGPDDVHRTLLENSNPNTVYGKLWKKTKFADGNRRFNIVMYEDEKAVSLGDRSGLEARGLSSGLCNWGVMKEKFFPAYFGIALPKNSPYTAAFSNEVKKMWEAGLLRKWQLMHTRNNTNTCELKAYKSRAIRFDDLFILVSLAGCCLAFCAIVLLCEIFYCNGKQLFGIK